MRAPEFLLDLLNETINKYLVADEELQNTGARLNEVILENNEKDKEIDTLKDRIEFLEVKNLTLTSQLEQLDNKQDDQLEELRYNLQVSERKVSTGEALLKELQLKLSDVQNSAANWRIEAEKFRASYIDMMKEKNELLNKYVRKSAHPYSQPVTTTAENVLPIGEVTEQSLPPLDNQMPEFQWDETEC